MNMTDVQCGVVGSAVGDEGTFARHSAVSTGHPVATQAALEILRDGGNAVDAAVAAAWSLSVCEPSASGLGGQTTVLMYRPGDSPRVFDGHSYAPRAVSMSTVTRAEQLTGYRACVIPSTVATLWHVHRRYGCLPPDRVMAAAIRIAEDGYEVSPLLQRQLRYTFRILSLSAAMCGLFLPGGRVPDVGCRLRHPALAATLRRLLVAGESDFYRGALAREIVDDMARHRGLLDAEDLSALTMPVERAALVGSYHGYRVVTAPPPAGGLQLLLGLKVLEHLERDYSVVSPELWRARLAQATYLVFRERELRDRTFDELPSEINQTLQDNWAAAMARTCGKQPPAPNHTAEEPGDTTHVSVVDAAGTVVTLTQSIQSVFGAKVANAQLGFVYNNYLKACPRTRHRRQLASGCLPRSNVAPTIVFGRGSQHDQPVLALGAAGSRRITSALLHVITGVLDRGLGLRDAISAPRVHALTSGKAWIERPAATTELLAELEGLSLRPSVKRPLDFAMGSVQAIHILRDGRIDAAADPRRDGTADGV